MFAFGRDAALTINAHLIQLTRSAFAAAAVIPTVLAITLYLATFAQPVQAGTAWVAGTTEAATTIGTTILVIALRSAVANAVHARDSINAVAAFTAATVGATVLIEAIRFTHPHALATHAGFVLPTIGICVTCKNLRRHKQSDSE